MYYDPVLDVCIAECGPAYPDLPCATLPSTEFLDMIFEIADLLMW